MIASLGLTEVSCMGVLLIWRVLSKNHPPGRGGMSTAKRSIGCGEPSTPDTRVSLQLLDLHLAPLDGAPGLLAVVAELQRERPARVLAVVDSHGLDAIQD